MERRAVWAVSGGGGNVDCTLGRGVDGRGTDMRAFTGLKLCVKI